MIFRQVLFARAHRSCFRMNIISGGQWAAHQKLQPGLVRTIDEQSSVPVDIAVATELLAGIDPGGSKESWRSLSFTRMPARTSKQGF